MNTMNAIEYLWYIDKYILNNVWVELTSTTALTNSNSVLYCFHTDPLCIIRELKHFRIQTVLSSCKLHTKVLVLK